MKILRINDNSVNQPGNCSDTKSLDGHLSMLTDDQRMTKHIFHSRNILEKIVRSGCMVKTLTYEDNIHYFHHIMLDHESKYSEK